MVRKMIQLRRFPINTPRPKNATNNMAHRDVPNRNKHANRTLSRHLSPNTRIQQTNDNTGTNIIYKHTN